MPQYRRRTYRKRPAGRRPTARKTYRRKNYSRSQPSRGVIRAPSGLPDKMYLKLRHSGTDLLSATTSMDYQIINANNMTSTGFAGGGQPYLFDEWMSLYSRYLVFGAKLSITFCNISASQPVNVWLGAFPTNSVIPTNELLWAMPYVRSAILAQEGSARPRTLSLYMATKKLLGLKRIGTELTRYTGDPSSGPTDEWFFHYYGQSTDEATAVSIRCILKIKYYVMLYDRKQVGES